jgi:hypothetical protein
MPRPKKSEELTTNVKLRRSSRDKLKDLKLLLHADSYSTAIDILAIRMQGTRARRDEE